MTVAVCKTSQAALQRQAIPLQWTPRTLILAEGTIGVLMTQTAQSPGQIVLAGVPSRLPALRVSVLAIQKPQVSGHPGSVQIAEFQPLKVDTQLDAKPSTSPLFIPA